MTTDPKTRIELRNGHIIDVVEGRYLDAGTRVIIEGERIAALPNTEERVEADLSVDLRGLTALPGLFNTHVHVTVPMPGPLIPLSSARKPLKHGRAQVLFNLSTCLDRGITSLRDCLCQDLRLIRNIKEQIEGARPRISSGVMVNQIGGTFTEVQGSAKRLAQRAVGLPALRYDDDDSGILAFPLDASGGDVRAAVDRAIDARGAQHIKVYDQREKQITYEPGATSMTQEQLDALADQARRRGVRTVIHHVSVESFRRAARAGIDTLAHLPLDGLITEDDARAFLEAGCTIEPTATLGYFYGFEQELGEHPRLAPLDELRAPESWERFVDLWVPPLRPLVRRSMERLARGDRLSFGFMDLGPVFRYYTRVLSKGFDNLRLLREICGLAPIACGNDAGPSPSTPAGVGLELDMLDLCLGQPDGSGLTGAEALRIATINSARAMGVEDDLGSIEPGKLADIALIDGDPLRDRSLIGAPVAALFKDGELVVNRCGLSMTPAADRGAPSA